MVLFLDTVVGRHSCGDLGCILPNVVSFIYVLALGHCSSFRDHKPSAWRIPNTHFTDMTMAYHVWPRGRNIPSFLWHWIRGPSTDGVRSLATQGTQKLAEWKSLWNPTSNLFWGVDLRFFGLNLPKIWVIWAWLVVDFLKHVYFLLLPKKGERLQNSINFSGSKIEKTS